MHAYSEMSIWEMANILSVTERTYRRWLMGDDIMPVIPWELMQHKIPAIRAYRNSIGISQPIKQKDMKLLDPCIEQLKRKNYTGEKS